MPAAQWDYENFVAASVNTPNATEGVICTTRAVNSPYAGAQFGVKFAGVFLAGAGTTAVVFRIRQTGLTGATLLGPETLSITAGQLFRVFFGVIDTTVAESSGAVWVLTATQTGGTGAGALSNGWTSVTTPV